VLVHDRSASAADWIAFMAKLRKLMGDDFDGCVQRLLRINRWDAYFWERIARI
jgi:hypothetical protein